MSKNISFISSSDYSKITFIGPVWKFSFSHSLCELYEHFEFSILFSMWLQTYAVLQKDNTEYHELSVNHGHTLHQSFMATNHKNEMSS